MNSADTVTFFYSAGSRYAYLAASQLASIEAESGCTFDWQPIDGFELRAAREAIQARHRSARQGAGRVE